MLGGEVISAKKHPLLFFYFKEKFAQTAKFDYLCSRKEKSGCSTVG
jgi:hypothetical protein